MDRKRVIGTGNGGIPWHLPRDIQYFREFTSNKYLLLGRRTFEEMSGWFTNQTPIVLTRDTNYEVEQGLAANHVEEAITIAAEEGASELAVCGGASIYAAALPYADELFLTEVAANVDGRALFPDYRDGIEWEEVGREDFPADDENNYGMSFLRLRRLRPPSLRTSRLHLH